MSTKGRDKHTIRTGGLLLFATACIMSAGALDWPRWRGPNANGITGEAINTSALAAGPKVVWKKDVGVGYSSVAVSGSLLYTMGNTARNDVVSCIEVGTGNTVWSYSYPCYPGSYPGPRATPTIDGDTVYTLGREGHLFCFIAATGEVRWQSHLSDDFGIRPPGWDFGGSPVVVGNLLLINAGRSGLALDKRTGRKVWDSGTASTAYATPVVYVDGGATAAAIFGQDSVYGVNVQTGAVLWSYPWRTGSDVNAADPIVSDGKVFVATAYNKGCAVIDFSGNRTRVVWQSKIFQTHFSSFVLIDGYLYGNDGDARQPTSGTFRCVDFDTGREQWSRRLGFGSLIAAGNKLVLLTSLGSLYVIEATPKGFLQLADTSLPRGQYWGPPALANGFLYCRTTTGDLYCIDVR